MQSFSQGQTNTQNHENQTTHNQTNNAGIPQHFKEYEHPISLVSKNTKRHSYKECKKCNRKKVPYDKNSDQCRNCYGASLRVLSGNKLIDDFIELTQTSHGSGFSVIYKATWVDGPVTRWSSKKQKYNRKGNYTVVLKCLNNSKKMDSDCLKKEEIKFPENIDVKSSPTKINEQAIYSSRLLNPLISEALTIRSMKLHFNGKH
ncbi:6860_t:CDS:2 [Gigaspora margarita]|uniref:6860_t:CDS:1 n=1 Tax=Gigaspora margarita TaxID=4874 RepID=A0ABN7V089_GIGMA|nr:6860_t:CDS:2 [Gigaspora margarita]